MQATELSERIVPEEEVTPILVLPSGPFLRSTEVVSREIGGEMMVVPICRGVGDLDSIFTFNAVGALLWSELAETRTEEELVGCVVRKFAVDEETAQEDVRCFL